MPAGAIDDASHRGAEHLLRGRGVSPEQADDLVHVGRDDGELIRGRAEGLQHGQRRRRRCVDQRGEVGAVGQAAVSGARRELVRNAAPQPDRELDRSICGRIRFTFWLNPCIHRSRLEHRCNSEARRLRHREVPSLRVRPERGSQAAKVDDHSFASCPSHDKCRCVLIRSIDASRSRQRDVLGRPMVHCRTSSWRQPTARLASFTGAGNVCSATMR